MTRKLALVLACLGLVHQAAYALGLGEIDVESALNQPFSATIDIRNGEALERNEIIATLASVEDFERVGVERFFFLSDLTFDTDLDGAEGPVLRVTSRQPITEPFVNFVVEVLWPSGRLLKEFTVLLDPPTYAARPVAAPLPATAAATSRIEAATPRPPSKTSPTPPANPTGMGAFVGDTYGVTDRNDTLWTIALKIRPDTSFSVQQTMLALLRLNPEAFIGNNINQLKAGYVLRVPDAAEIRRLALADAVVQVNEQNNRWRSGLDSAPLDARASVAETRGEGGSGGGELRLVSETSSSSATGSGGNEADRRGAASATAAEDGALRSELASAQSQLEGARRQTSALRGELQESGAERDALERQLQIKDEQIAQLQRALAQQLEEQDRTSSPAAASRTSPRAASSGLFGFSWWVVAGAIGGLIALGVGALLALRRVSAGSEVQEDTGSPEAAIQRSIDETQMMPALTEADLPSAGSGNDTEEGEDVLAEADVYMAYGNFSEAAASLGAALDADPNRADIRLKLLEVYVEQGDVEGFNAQARALAEIADSTTVAASDALAARLPGASSSSGAVTSGDPAAPALRESAEGGVSLDFDLALDESDTDEDPPADLDSLDIDLDLGDFDSGSLAREAEAGLDVDEGSSADDGVDHDIDLDGLEIAGDEAAEASTEDFTLALEGDDKDDDSDNGGIDFDLDTLEEPAGETGSAGDLDFEIDELDEGVGDAGVSPEPTGEFADRTLIMERVDLEIPQDDATDQAPDDDSFEFDIDELAGPDDSEVDLAFEDEVLSVESDPEPLLDTEGELLLDDDAFSLEDDGGVPVEADDNAASDTSDDLAFGSDDFLREDADSLSAQAKVSPAIDASDDWSLEGDGFSLEEDSDLDFELEDTGEPQPSTADADTGTSAVELDFELDEAFDFGDASDADEITTKLELARAYIDMSDEDGAREILEEVVRDGDQGQQKEAGDLLSQIG